MLQNGIPSLSTLPQLHYRNVWRQPHGLVCQISWRNLLINCHLAILLDPILKNINQIEHSETPPPHSHPHPPTPPPPPPPPKKKKKKTTKKSNKQIKKKPPTYSNFIVDRNVLCLLCLYVKLLSNRFRYFQKAHYDFCCGRNSNSKMIYYSKGHITM